MRTFQDLHVVVTGATGELGGAVAALLLERGARCHLPVRSAAKLDPALARAHVVSGIDLADEAGVTAFYRDLPELWASIHCAGAFAYTPIEAASGADLDKMLAVNARSAFLCAREAARVLRAGAHGGRIVNVVSRQALEPRRGAGLVPYTMSKAAVAALTQALAEELAPERIGVNAVAPSILDTPANRAAMPNADVSKWISLAEVAEVMLFLASPDCTASGTLAQVYGRA
ncbi:MAG: SDR family NAD(P)-dependent oxidoreductase [Planctomycetes bacterium]|nr:SDR family NAD(P)-dependent oxidoreductase [Planctomycetota bacterium]